MVAIFDPLGVRQRFEPSGRGVPDGPTAIPNPRLGAFSRQAVFPEGLRKFLRGQPDGEVPRDLIRN